MTGDNKALPDHIFRREDINHRHYQDQMEYIHIFKVEFKEEEHKYIGAKIEQFYDEFNYQKVEIYRVNHNCLDHSSSVKFRCINYKSIPKIDYDDLMDQMRQIHNHDDEQI
ncbi:hypothetical protein QTN25_000001 [Entamoeba marina]